MDESCTCVSFFPSFFFFSSSSCELLSQRSCACVFMQRSMTHRQFPTPNQK